MSESHSPEYEDNEDVVHEESDVDVGSILRFGTLLGAVVAVVILFLVWLQGFYMRGYEAAQAEAVTFPMALGQREAQPPSPRLQTYPQQELRDLIERSTPALEEYGWINQEAGIARIPIDEAMRIVVERGLPTRESAPAQAAPAAPATK